MNYSSDTAGNDLLIQFIVFNKVRSLRGAGIDGAGCKFMLQLVVTPN
jgi:hypothetical protein